MKKNTILIIFLVIALLFSGCTKDNKQVNTNENKQQQEVEETNNGEDTSEEEKIEDVKEEEVNPIDKIDLSLKPNELGEIMILMYHGIGQEETTWQRTPDNFRKDLEYMYQNGYRMISLNDYARGEIKTAAGYTPIILTFDDGRQKNFNLIEKNGELIIDPDCAIGILEEFKSKYPDFNVTASFFLGTNIFGQKEHEGYKLKWLVENGYDIGNHTYSHNEIAQLNSEQINMEIGSVISLVNSYIPDYAVETIALPHGSNPKDEYSMAVLQGEYEGKSYKNIAVLDVGWRPAYSPFDTMTDFTSLYRVTASEIEVDNCGIYDYFKQFADNKREKFISDGNPNVITIPKKHEEYLNKDFIKDKLVNIYE